MGLTDDVDRKFYVCQRTGITTLDIVEYIDIEQAILEKERSEAFTALTDSLGKLGVYGNCLLYMEHHFQGCQNCQDVYEEQVFVIDVFRALNDEPLEEGLEYVVDASWKRCKN